MGGDEFFFIIWLKEKQLHTHLESWFLLLQCKDREINYLFPLAYNCYSLLLMPDGGKKNVDTDIIHKLLTYLLAMFCGFPSYNKVKISKSLH